MTIKQVKKLNKFNIPNNSINIYGNHPAKSALLSSNRSCYLLCTTEKKFDYWNNFVKSNKVNIKIVLLETFEINNISNSKNHQGVIARISPIKFFDINEFSEIIEKSKIPFILILDQISDVRNFGAIIRSAEISGVDGVIIQNSFSAPINSDTVKTSAGAIFNIPICKVSHIKDAIYHLQSMDISIICASEKAEKNIYDVNFKRPVAIVMGSEQKGINKSVLSLSNEMVKLPIFGKIESLNVSVACGIPQATETFNDSIFPKMGSFTISLDKLRTDLLIPFCSDPITIATGLLKFTS